MSKSTNTRGWRAGLIVHASAMAALGGIPLTPPAEAQTAEAQHVLFAVSVWYGLTHPVDGRRLDIARIEPIGVFVGDDVVPVTTEAGRDPFRQFRAEYYDRGHRYRVFNRNEMIGSATVDSVSDLGCIINQADVSLDVSKPLEGSWGAIATNRELGGTQIGSEADQERKDQLLAFGRAMALERGVQQQLIDSAAVVGPMLVFAGGERDDSVVVGTIGATMPLDQGGYQGISVLIIAGTKSDSFEDVFTRWSEDRHEREVVLDVLDLDGDGLPEVITESTFWEWSNYGIYRRRVNGWEEIFRGGGGGC